ncbi:MAG: uroporphyrinogen-III synthase [Xanthomonadales bacterium]|nr:uroporphyrinogen-III synthase [Xanthomonadales bacterium]
MADKPAPARGRVLVTRPAGGSSDALCAAVERAGFEAFRQPLLQVDAMPELSGAQRSLLLDLDLYQHVIFISSNAVRFGMDRIEEYWPQIPVGISWYAIGDATAALLASFGIEAVTPGAAMTSEGLLALPGLLDVLDERVLIVKGEGGRETLRNELAGRGARVDELACYRRSLPEMSAGALAEKLIAWGIDVILVSSGEGLANLQLLLTPTETSKLKPMALVVPSERVARLARGAGFDQVVTAENASDTAMVHALETWSPGMGG